MLPIRHHAGRLNQWVDDAAAAAKTPMEVSVQLPRHLGAGRGRKAIFVRGQERCLLAAVDQTSQDIVYALVLDSESDGRLLRYLLEAPRRQHST
jgi:hypothetical protein